MYVYKQDKRWEKMGALFRANKVGSGDKFPSKPCRLLLQSRRSRLCLILFKFHFLSLENFKMMITQKPSVPLADCSVTQNTRSCFWNELRNLGRRREVTWLFSLLSPTFLPLKDVFLMMWAVDGRRGPENGLPHPHAAQYSQSSFDILGSDDFVCLLAGT